MNGTYAQRLGTALATLVIVGFVLGAVQAVPTPGDTGRILEMTAGFDAAAGSDGPGMETDPAHGAAVRDRTALAGPDASGDPEAAVGPEPGSGSSVVASRRQVTPPLPVGQSTETQTRTPESTPRPTPRPTDSPTPRSRTSRSPADAGTPEVTAVQPTRTTVREGQPVTVLARVVNRADRPRRVTLEFRLFGEVLDVRSMRLPATASKTVKFTRTIDAPGQYHPAVNDVETTVRVKPAGGDGSNDTARPTSGAIGPGFTPVAAVLALVAAAILRRRW